MADFIIDDYQYTIIESGKVKAQVVDKTKTSYSNLSTSVVNNGTTYSVTSMDYCFDGCSNLIEAPAVPNSVTTMKGCFNQCVKLVKAPTIPNSVTNMNSCFYSCNKIENIIVLPNSVVDTSYCFYRITKALIVVAQNNPTVYNSMFFDAVIIGPVSSSKITVVLIESANETTWDTIIGSYSARSIVKRRLFNNDIDVEIGDYHYSHSNGNFYATDVIDTTKTTYGPLLPITTHMTQTFANCSNLVVSPEIPSPVTNMSSCFYLCSSLVTAPVIPSSVTNMNNTFAYCEALISAPIIPNFITSMNGCFKNCISLRGNIIINNLPTNGSTEIFVDTINDIYIINNFPTSTTEQQRIANQAAMQWRSIAGQYENVHYEADDKNGPIVSAVCSRVDNQGEVDTFGTYANLVINSAPNDTNLPPLVGLPEGKSFPSSEVVKTELYIDDNSSSKITIDTTGLTSINYSYDLSQSIASDDILNRHIFNVVVTDTYNKETTYSVILPRAAAILDFLGYPLENSLYLDNPGTGMAIGKFATRSGLDIEYPTTVGQGLVPAYTNQYEPVDINTETFDPNGEYYITNSYLEDYLLVEEPNETNFNNGDYYHLKGRVIDLYNPQLIVGQYNIMNPEATFIIGNGVDDEHRSNALEIYNNGAVSFDNNAGQGILAAIIDLIYPVGCYFETSNPTFDPNLEFGGIWVEETPGMVHVSAGTGYPFGHANDNNGVGAQDGGSPYIQEHSHGFTGGALPTHTHGMSHTHVPNSTTYKYFMVTSSSGITDDTSAALSDGNYKFPRISSSYAFTSHSTTGTSSIASTGNNTSATTSGTVGNINTANLSKGQSGNMQPYIVVYRWHRYA